MTASLPDPQALAAKIREALPRTGHGDGCPCRDCTNARSLSVALDALVALADGAAQLEAGEREEMRCDRCHRYHGVVWFAPSEVWNAVMRDGDKGNPDEFAFCCPECFIHLAEERGIKPTGWLVAPEDLAAEERVAAAEAELATERGRRQRNAVAAKERIAALEAELVIEREANPNRVVCPKCSAGLPCESCKRYGPALDAALERAAKLETALAATADPISSWNISADPVHVARLQHFVNGVLDGSHE